MSMQEWLKPPGYQNPAGDNWTAFSKTYILSDIKI